MILKYKILHQVSKLAALKLDIETSIGVEFITKAKSGEAITKFHNYEKSIKIVETRKIYGMSIE
ncbi:MAG TPA: hypothetical protein DEF85_08825 [Clostridiaceae bacterium]|nr:hypothetical protein [Clostridiaceae bacterium]HBG39643.1 hypothetical protein [Clostridiaceae bacterium]HBN28976.1 hypothetical protein [Clostridiaceae bacterium]HBX48977.1 hypothetical protein [Clostridiaceae bacterium]